jgi:hypothetical protein
MGFTTVASRAMPQATRMALPLGTKLLGMRFTAFRVRLAPAVLEFVGELQWIA